MKTKIMLSLITGAMLFTGCADLSNSLNLSAPSSNDKNITKAFQKAKSSGGGLKEYITELNKDNPYGVKIYADKPNESILKTRMHNENGIGMNDIYEVTEQLSDYCEKIGGKWIYGNQYGALLKVYSNIKVNPILSLKAIPQQLRANTSNYGGFGKCEAGENGFEVEYELGFFEVGDNSWSRYYKLVFNKPQKTDDFIVRSYHSLFTKDYHFKNWDNFENYAKKKRNFYITDGKDNNFMANSYVMCLKYGGKMYVKDRETDYQEMNFNNYVFRIIDSIHNEHPEGTDLSNDINYETYAEQINFFNTDGVSGYIWCQNSKNPKHQFTYVYDNDSYIFEPYLDKRVQPVKIVKTQILPLSKADKVALNIAKKLFATKKDIDIKYSHNTKYHGYYIGRVGDYVYVGVDKKINNKDVMFTFRECGGHIQYLGNTSKRLPKEKIANLIDQASALYGYATLHPDKVVTSQSIDKNYYIYCKYKGKKINKKLKVVTLFFYVYILDNQHRLIKVEITSGDPDLIFL